MIAFDRPWLLLLLPPALLLPLLVRQPSPSGVPDLALVVADPLSTAVALALRAAGMIALAALVLAVAGPGVGGGTVTREGIGANIVFLFDRSSSMDNSFADRLPNGDEESKATVAKRLILEFLDRRPRDRIGVAAFSTTPMMVMGINDHLNAVRGAVAAIDKPGLAHTDVGRGLILALDMFGERTGGESRALILVSDGAGVIGREVQDALRAAVKRNPANLYWLFIRSKGSYGLFEVPARKSDDTPRARPERHLHLFLQSLGIPYKALEAQSPEAIGEAIAEIDRLESKPITYVETTPRTALAPALYAVAATALAALAAAVTLERGLVSAGPGLLPPLRRVDGAR